MPDSTLTPADWRHAAQRWDDAADDSTISPRTRDYYREVAAGLRRKAIATENQTRHGDAA